MTPPAQTTRRRSWGVVVLAVTLLAVLVLAGVGAAASLRAGARAERVRGLVPFAGALTTLVDELQRERSLSTALPVPGPALEPARDAVDRAAAAYRDAAVRVEISDRDRALHRRLTDGLAQLACITASLSYALAAVWARRFRRMGLSPMSVTTGQLIAGALMMLPLAFLVDQPWTQPFPPLTAVASITALALLIVATVASYVPARRGMRMAPVEALRTN